MRRYEWVASDEPKAARGPPSSCVGRSADQGVQVPDVGVPGDCDGRGLTSTGYGSVG